MNAATIIQPMPDLDAEQLEALRADIAAHGVRVPVVKDQHGRILDGNNRAAIADELGIDYPVQTVEVADDDEAHEVALSLNLARRHLTREQVRDLIRAELHRKWQDADRAIARRIGCSPTTVGTVRAAMMEEAAKRTQSIRAHMAEVATNMRRAALDLVTLGADINDIIRRADEAQAVAAAQMKALAAGKRAEDVANTAAWVAAQLDWYVYLTLRNDVQDVADSLASEGWTGCPPKLPPHELTAQVSALFPLATVQVGQSATADLAGGAR